jgi:hypothetical protein
MVKKTTHEFFRGANKGRCFIYEYLWDVAKEMPKWRRIIQEESTPKRTKLSNSGVYTSSSNQDTEGETMSRLWEREELANIMYACIILHNMIIEDERGIYDTPDDNTYEQAQSSPNLTGQIVILQYCVS